jgi:hypothetical protein
MRATRPYGIMWDEVVCFMRRGNATNTERSVNVRGRCWFAGAMTAFLIRDGGLRLNGADYSVAAEVSQGPFARRGEMGWRAHGPQRRGIETPWRIATIVVGLERLRG